MLMWVAFFNRYPLLSPDSLDYIKQGSRIITASQVPRSAFTAGMTARAEIYCLALLPLHWNRTPWPILAAQSLLASYVIWLIVRCVAGRGHRAIFPPVIVLLSALTSISWFASSVAPDILGSLVYLSMYLLLFEDENLTGLHRWAVSAVMFLGIVSHTTHILLSMGVAAIFTLLVILRWAPMRGYGPRILKVTAIIAFGVLSQVMLHGYLYGKLSLSGQHPPYLTARLVADGPARLYLQQHCQASSWVICKRVSDLPRNSDEFLWLPTGVWQAATMQDKEQMLREETPLLIATLRTYPRAQFHRSLDNFGEQFLQYRLSDFMSNAFVRETADSIMPGAGARYVAGRQWHDSLPALSATRIEVKVVSWSAVALVPLLIWAGLKRRSRMLALAITILPTLVLNALICGVLSEVANRYQARIIWLVPFLAIVLILDALTSFRAPAGKELRS